MGDAKTKENFSERNNSVRRSVAKLIEIIRNPSYQQAV